jgi:hydroxycarboxylate dehydrogenase B
MPTATTCGPPPGPKETSLYAAEGLTQFVAGVLGAIGTSDPDARFMAEVIVAAELSGHECHGLRRLPEYVDRWRCGKANPAATASIDLDCGALVRIDGQHGFGHLSMRAVTDLAVERARLHGIAGVAVHRTEHAGRFADYCERAAAAGVASLIFANDAGGGQSVAPPRATEPRLSTNPVAAGVPRANAPHLVLDMATSVVAAGRLSESIDRAEQIPAEWVTSTGC